jgi:hypothetical protein
LQVEADVSAERYDYLLARSRYSKRSTTRLNKTQLSDCLYSLAFAARERRKKIESKFVRLTHGKFKFRANGNSVFAHSASVIHAIHTTNYTAKSCKRPKGFSNENPSEFLEFSSEIARLDHLRELLAPRTP